MENVVKPIKLTLKNLVFEIQENPKAKLTIPELTIEAIDEELAKRLVTQLEKMQSAKLPETPIA